MGSRKPAQEAVLECLVRLGGEVYDKSGRTTSILATASNYAGSPTGLSQLLTNMERNICPCGEHFVIEREKNTRRCYKVVVAPCLLTEPEPEPEPIEEEPQVEELDYDHLAMSLVTTFIDALAPKVMDPELQRRLGKLHEHARSVEVQRDRLRRELELAGEELAARRTEVQGLRERLRVAEENIERLQTAARDPWTSTDEAIDRLMRETPAPSHGN